MAHHVIYIPGLGDRRSYGQKIVLRFWRFFGLRLHYFPLRWADKEKFELKLTRLLDRIDNLMQAGHRVSLVGISAGASAALNAYALRKDLVRVVLVGGKVHNPQAISEKVYEINPAFKESLYLLQSNLKKLDRSDKARIMSVHPKMDAVVPIADTKIVGAIEKTVPVVGQVPGIFYSITLGSPAIASFLKS